MEKIKVTDELLKKVLPKVNDEIIDEYEKIMKECTEEHVFSKQFEEQIKKLIGGEK